MIQSFAIFGGVLGLLLGTTGLASAEPLDTWSIYPGHDCLNDPYNPIRADGTRDPQGDPAPGTPEWDARDAEHVACTDQRDHDSRLHPLRNVATAFYGEDVHRQPELLDGTRFHWAEFPAFGIPGVPSAELYHPCSNAAGDCPALPPELERFDPPYPVVVVFHGIIAQYSHHRFITQALAEHGYLAIGVNGTIPAGSGPNSQRTENGNDVLVWLDSPDSGIYGEMADLDRVAFAGHSQGGAATQSYQGDPRIHAMIVYDAGDAVSEDNLAQPTMFQRTDGGFATPEARTAYPEDRHRALGAYEDLKSRRVDVMNFTARATVHTDWNGYGVGLAGNRLIELVINYYTLAWVDRYLKGRLVLDAAGRVVPGAGRSSAGERAYRQRIAEAAFERLTARYFDDSADRHNISMGFWDPGLAAASGDPVFGGNVPYTVVGEETRDRFSPYFQSVCALSVPDYIGGGSGLPDDPVPPRRRADTGADGDMRFIGCPEVDISTREATSGPATAGGTLGPLILLLVAGLRRRVVLLALSLTVAGPVAAEPIDTWPLTQGIDCIGDRFNPVRPDGTRDPSLDPRPGTPEWEARDAERLACDNQRDEDSRYQPPFVLAHRLATYGQDYYRRPEFHDGVRFRYDYLPAGELAPVGLGIPGAAGAEIYRPCAPGQCPDLPGGLQRYPPPYPVVVIWHGAIAQMGHHRFNAQTFAEAGYLAVLLNGTALNGAPNFPDAAHGGAVLDWLASGEAGEFGAEADLGRVGFAGHSAGAGAAGEWQGDPRIDAFVAWDSGSLGDTVADNNCVAPDDPCQPIMYLRTDGAFSAPQASARSDYPEERDRALGPYESHKARGMDVMHITFRATNHIDWNGNGVGALAGNRYAESVINYYSLAWLDRHVKAKLVQSGGQVVTSGGRSEAAERAHRQAIAQGAFDRLTARVFPPGSIDQHNISTGQFDPVQALAPLDPLMGGNVPYQIEGLFVSDRLSPEFRNLCRISVPDYVNGASSDPRDPTPLAALADTGGFDPVSNTWSDMRLTGCRERPDRAGSRADTALAGAAGGAMGWAFLLLLTSAFLRPRSQTKDSYLSAVRRLQTPTGGRIFAATGSRLSTASRPLEASR